MKIPPQINNISQNSSISSKIPFQSRKIRKLTSKTPTNTITKISIAAATDSDHSPKTLKPLTFKGEIDVALQYLRDRDPLLATLIDAHRPPALESSRSPFLSLSKSILYQQLAYKAAKSIYTRFVSLFNGEDNVLPDAVLALSPQRLREIGVSYRKASYLHDLADKFTNGVLSDESILEMDDETMFKMLTSVKGIGAWSVHMFMIFSLHKPDVLPVGDLGVRKGVQILYGLKELPGALIMEEVCEKWRPYRSVGSWYMWRLMEAKGVLPNVASAVAVTDVEAPYVSAYCNLNENIALLFTSDLSQTKMSPCRISFNVCIGLTSITLKSYYIHGFLLNFSAKSLSLSLPPGLSV